MTKFEVLKRITGVEEYSRLVFEFVKKSGSPEELAKELSRELPADAMKTLTRIANSKNYPLSLEGMQ